MKNWEKDRNKIIGLGEFSAHKSYYPQLQLKLEELELAYKNSENILSSMPDAVIIHDSSGNFLYMNKQAGIMFGIHEQETTLYSYSHLIDDFQSSDLILHFKKLTPGKTNSFQCDIHSINSDEQTPVEISSNSIMWQGKKAIVSVVRDFTLHKQFEDSIIKAKQKAEENDQLKSAFLANMSHEIRTPMNGIIGFVDLLKEPDLTEEKHYTYLEILTKSCDRLLSTINDIIEFSKIESGQTHVNLSPQNLKEILVQQWSFFYSEASRKGNRLVLAPSKSDEIVLVDRLKLESIVSNLIKNAIKFTSEGTISISYKIEKPYIEFCIKDTGIGIAKERQEAIFKRFVQANIEITRGHEGSGLGLSICKAYAEMMGGNIWVESEENKGSSFYFTIAYQPVPKAL
ncbi:PAS domain-containing sensor histidine kinase [uncultured Draconibacterium sp.]|uniref:PAS domain-containing sensor histidine kinase n=1 Tax=uncultured Draconibacterium sp. TaxID=1573823 RepID=UPI003217B8D5